MKARSVTSSELDARFSAICARSSSRLALVSALIVKSDLIIEKSKSDSSARIVTASMSSMPCWCQSDSRKSASAARSLPVTSASEVNTSSRWTSSSQVRASSSPSLASRICSAKVAASRPRPWNWMMPSGSMSPCRSTNFEAGDWLELSTARADSIPGHPARNVAIRGSAPAWSSSTASRQRTRICSARSSGVRTSTGVQEGR